MRGKFSLVATLTVVLGVSSAALGSTLTTNSTWTIDRSGTSTKYRITGYGDSIYAGWYGSAFAVAKTAAPEIAGEYQATWWNADMEIVRRTKSGAKADAIYNEKIVGERSYMQSSNTKVVTFEMCGNDYLQARSAFASQTGTCDLSGLDTALSNCTYYMGVAMDYINANKGANVVARNITNIYYPGYNADNVLTGCTIGGVKKNRRDLFLPYLAKSNWRACDKARQKGFSCTDSFASFMAADYDTNGDGLVDSNAIKYVSGESESAYVTKITSTYKATLRDANNKLINSTTSADYIQSDDTHPTYYGSTTCSYGIWPGGTCSGSSAQAVPPYTNRQGHTRMGHGIYLLLP
jgi:lysophospholipase L1-like esterase